jgi:glycosyltransferase involved in cell wall biosynthesis
MRALRVSHSGVMKAWRERERGLRALGVDVTLATARCWNEGGKDIRFSGDADELVVPLRTFGRHPNAFLFDPRPLWWLLGQGWDILDIHEEPCSLATAELLVLRRLRARRVPFLLYSAQNVEKHYPLPFRWIERWSLSRAAGAYVCNIDAGKILRSKGLRGELREIPLGVDTSRFSPTEHPPPEGALRVGYVGRLEEYKGVGTLIEAVSGIAEATLEIIGAGPQADALAALSNRLGVADKISFRGFVDQGDLPDQYRQFDVVAVPSLPRPGWREQFCRVAVEAMASGIPTVVSDTGALPEVVGDGGLLVPAGDADALRAALRRLLDEPEIWLRTRQAALDRAPDFAWPVVVEAHRELYEDVVSP